MAFLSGIFDRGGNNQQQQPQQQNNQQPNNQQQPQMRPSQQQQPNQNGSGGPAGSQQAPANGQMQNTENPLDNYMKMMTPSADVQKEQQTWEQQKNAPLFGNMTPEAMQEQVKKMNFTSNLNPEQIQKALGGDVQAFMDVINQSTQAAFSASMQVSKGMVEHGVTTGTQRFDQGLDSRFREFQVRGQNSKHPALQHPLGKSMLDAAKQSILRANPRMDPTEVQSKAESMFADFAKMFQTQEQNEQAKNAPKEADWMQFLDEQPQQ